MRIPSGVTDQYIYFVAVDSTDLKTRETGLTTFTVYRSRDGAAAAAMTTPTVNETDTTNMPGVYELLLDEDMTIGSGNDSEEMVFHITQASMAPVTRTIELYRPKLTAGNTLDVTATGAAGIDWGNVENPTTALDLSGTDIQLADTATTVTNQVTADMTAISGDTTAANNAESFFDGTGYAGTNNVIPAVTTVTTTTNVTNQVTADVTAISGDGPAADNLELDYDGTGYAKANSTIGTTTTNTDMRGTDNAATAAALTTHDGKLDTVDTNVDAILVDTDTTIPGLIAALNDLSAAAVNAEVVDALATDTYAEPTGVPAATVALATKIGYIYMALRNQVTVTATKKTFFDDGGAAEWEKDLSDDATTYTETEANAI